MLDMADKLVGGFFAKARNATRQRYVASAGTVGRLMRLFHGTIDALPRRRVGAVGRDLGLLALASCTIGIQGLFGYIDSNYRVTHYLLP